MTLIWVPAPFNVPQIRKFKNKLQLYVLFGICGIVPIFTNYDQECLSAQSVRDKSCKTTWENAFNTRGKHCLHKFRQILLHHMHPMYKGHVDRYIYCCANTCLLVMRFRSKKSKDVTSCWWPAEMCLQWIPNLYLDFQSRGQSQSKSQTESKQISLFNQLYLASGNLTKNIRWMFRWGRVEMVGAGLAYTWRACHRRSKLWGRFLTLIIPTQNLKKNLEPFSGHEKWDTK